MTFAEEIKTARKARSMTHKDLAEVLDVSISSVQKWEYGLSEPLEVTKQGIRKRLDLRLDLPHLRDGKWMADGGLPQKRFLFYLNRLKKLGMPENDARGMLSDLYWDCYQEIKANEQFGPK